MPVQLESLKLAQVQKFSGRHIFFTLIIGSAIGAITVWWKLLDAFYLEGGSRGFEAHVEALEVRTTNLCAKKHRLDRRHAKLRSIA